MTDVKSKKTEEKEHQDNERSEMAIRKLAISKKMKKDSFRKGGFYDPVMEMDAKRLEREGKELLEVGEVQRLTGNEAVEWDREDVSLFRETLKNPTSVNVDASVNRMQLFSEFGHLQMAVDAAETIDARNSLEKMLAHQMTACHIMSMKLMGNAIKYTQSHVSPEIERPVKLVNAAARLMDTYQRGLTTLAKNRRGGRQKVTVEHVHVNKGGQAIVGNV